MRPSLFEWIEKGSWDLGIPWAGEIRPFVWAVVRF